MPADRAGPAAAGPGGINPTTRAAASPAPACGAPRATSRRPPRCWLRCLLSISMLDLALYPRQTRPIACIPSQVSCQRGPKRQVSRQVEMPVDAGTGQGASADACGSGRGSRSSRPRSWRSLETLAHMCGCPSAAESRKSACKHDVDTAPHRGHLQSCGSAWGQLGVICSAPICVRRSVVAAWDVQLLIRLELPVTRTACLQGLASAGSSANRELRHFHQD